MLRTENLRRQHDAALAMVDAINASIEEMGEEPALRGVFGLTMSIAKLSGTLRIHFAQEDQHLYPSLMASGQGGVAATARRFLDEMGQIGPAFNSFTEKWRDSATIVRNWADFRSETRAIFEALATRIHCENDELYPLADEMASYSWSGRAA